MQPDSLPYVLALIATALLAASLALYAFQRRFEGRPVATFAALLIALTWYCGSAALELMAPTLQGKIIATQMKYAGLGALGPHWLAFALSYTRRDYWLKWPAVALMALPSLVGLVAVVTNDLHHLVWTGFRLEPDSPALIVTGYGPLFWLYLGAQYVLMLAAAAVYLLSYTQTAYVYRQQIGLMVAGALVPLLGNAIYLAGVYPVPGLDLTPFSLAMSALFLAIGLFRFGLLDVQPIAARVVFNHLSDPVMVLDSQDRVIDLNPAARRVFGVTETAIGQPAPAALRQAETDHRALGGGSAWPELQVGEGDHRHWYRVESSPLRDAHARPVGRVVVLVDISGERLLQQLRSDLTHMLVHDLSNPLSAMQMAAEMLRFEEPEPGQPLQLDPEARSAVTIIRRSLQRAQRLVRSLLDINQLEAGSMPIEMEFVDPKGLAEGIVRDMRLMADERRLDLKVLAENGLPPVHADPDLLDRVLRNLVGNALKYTPEGGQVDVAVQANGASQAGVVFTVRDTGEGLPPKIQSRLFEKFVRGEGPQHGHGLGLAFCKLAVEAMGGRIWAESAAGQGAAFHVALKAAEEDGV